MGFLSKIKDIGIKFTCYVGGRAFDKTKQKRTGAVKDLIKNRKRKNGSKMP